MLEVKMDKGSLRYFNDGAEITRSEYLAMMESETEPQEKTVIAYAVKLDGTLEVMADG